MKTLLIVRHAKSSWKETNLPDQERPLSKRGKRDAPKMGERLARQGIQVDLLLSSPAKRALATAKIFAEQMGYLKPIVQTENLYETTEWHILDLIHSLDNNNGTVMLVGHNPGLTDLVNEISGRRLENIPTCGVVWLEYDIKEWQKVGRLKPSRFEFDYPKS